MLKYAYIGCENRNIPATAPNDSCRATLPAENGFVTRISARANDKVVALAFIRPSTNHDDKQPHEADAYKRRSAVFAEQALQYADKERNMHAGYGDHMRKAGNIH